MTTDKKYLLIYHKEDNDGVFSGAMFYDYLTEKLHVAENAITLLPADYVILAKFAKEHPVEALHGQYDSIIMTDISFNDTAYMKALYDEFTNDFVWCDHHAPVIKESSVKKFCDAPGVRETDRSAILCVYKYLYDPFDEHYKDRSTCYLSEFYRILSAWDSWTYAQNGYDIDYVMKVNKGALFHYKLDLKEALCPVRIMRRMREDPEGMASMDDDSRIDECLQAGEMIVEYDRQNNEYNVMNSGDFEWVVSADDGCDAHTACMLVAIGASSSQMFSCVKNRVRHGIVCKRKADGQWTISLYNTNNDDPFHCGEYLKARYGGGGHQGAAGCTVSEDKFFEILKKKSI